MLEVAEWAEAAGCRGLLTFTDHYTADPWALGQLLLESTNRLVPLVAVQPAYMHPFTAARLVSTMSCLYGRPVDLNLVTGGHRAHLRGLGCHLDHDERYDQLLEYGRIITALLTDPEPITHTGRHYDVPERPEPGVAGRPDAPDLRGGCVGRLPSGGPRTRRRPAHVSARAERVRARIPALAGAGIRVGIIARDTREEAWRIAHERYPEDPVAERLARVAYRFRDSHWSRRLQADAEIRLTDNCYWLYPLRSGGEYCPYLVGNHAEVAETVAR